MRSLILLDRWSVVKTRIPVDGSLKSQDRNTHVLARGMLSRDTVQKVNVCVRGDWAMHALRGGTHGGIWAILSVTCIDN